jgi:hypothetical protein
LKPVHGKPDGLKGYSFIGEQCYIIVQRGKVMDKYPLIRKVLLPALFIKGGKKT